MIKKGSMAIPTWLVNGLPKESRDSREAGFIDAAWLLRLYREHYERELEALYKASEELLTHEEYIYNASKRKALRTLIRDFPKPL